MQPHTTEFAPVAFPIVLQARIPVGLLLLCLTLIAIGLAAASSDRYMEVALIAVMAGMIGLLQHFPGLSTLTLDDKGFVVKGVFGSRAVAWRDASNFRPVKKRRTEMVAWDDGAGNPSPPQARAQILAAWKSVDAATLAALLNRTQQQATGTSH
ncbi:hypothetical protein [Noviherbaspirillum sp. Root189]|uniref:hypothetical protein n=1 Tax=Noviherbaspirillum sp. Root189 TaxID=1736487 RepID=UPI00070AEFD6|nr:hypothetical protein [Noviherbaspirillum sp. Root189]KRB93990.1 hypothetical protein ASE07_00090 [Noviherbaspirillum sp. Root189]